MPQLVLPETARPANLYLSEGSRARLLTSDVYDICNRVAELDPSLYIIELEHDDPRPYRYIVMERCKDGVDRMALRVREGELDARVIDELRYQLAVPFSERMARVERELEQWSREHRENESEALYEKIGPEFHRQLERCGFITMRPKSFPKRGIRTS